VRGEIVRELRTNRQIKAREVLLIGEAGEQMGVMPLYKAWQVASEHGLDLVEVAATANPPVCRLMDYGKYKYERAKREREARKTQKVAFLREIRLRPKIDEHDLDAKVRLVKKLLAGGDKVKVSIFFRGREVTHPEIGWKLLQVMLDSLKDVALVEGTPVTSGKNMNIVFSPISAKRAKEAMAAKEAENAKA
jgi:translation initiation factor IF-3